MIRGKIRTGQSSIWVEKPHLGGIVVRNGKEVKTTSKCKSDRGWTIQPAYSDYASKDFDEFWEMYPSNCKKREKGAGSERWSFLTDVEKSEIFRWLKSFIETASIEDQRKLPRTNMFINQRRWEQENPLLDTGVRGVQIYRGRDYKRDFKVTVTKN